MSIWDGDWRMMVQCIVLALRHSSDEAEIGAEAVSFGELAEPPAAAAEHRCRRYPQLGDAADDGLQLT
jgi:hypothetical protein